MLCDEFRYTTGFFRAALASNAGSLPYDHPPVTPPFSATPVAIHARPLDPWIQISKLRIHSAKQRIRNLKLTIPIAVAPVPEREGPLPDREPT